MGDEYEAALKVVDGVGEGVDGLHVEVVGGLVEEQHVRRLPRQPREHHATPLPVRQLLDRARLRGEGKCRNEHIIGIWVLVHQDLSRKCNAG